MTNGTFVRQLEVRARVGVKPDELQRVQVLRLDIDVTHPGTTLAADTGRLRDTLDYRGIARTAEQVVARGHFRLVETLAVEIARALLHHTRAETVRVRLCKPDCIPGAAAAGVEVSLDQDALHRDPKPLTASQIASPESVAIVGGGVAGLAAALWCWRLGHPALLVTPGPQLGGQLQQVHFRMPDIPGLEPTSGHALARRLIRQFITHRGRWFSAHLTALRAGPSSVDLQLEATGDGRQAVAVKARTVILATGARRRPLGVAGETELQGKGILQTASSAIRQLSGKRIVVVGGGDAACENALKLARVGAEVHLVFRRADLSARERFRRRVAAQQKITLVPQSEISEFRGGDRLESVRLTNNREIQTNWALVRAGWLPNSEALCADWLDDRGFLRCDSALRVVGQQRVFAAGDLRNPAAPSVACSSGDGAAAAKAATALLEC